MTSFHVKLSQSVWRKFVFPAIQMVSDLIKPIRLHEIPDSRKADRPFKEKFGLSL